MSDAKDRGRASEQKMRRMFEARRGVPFSDEEWDEAKRNLVRLFLMIRTRDVDLPDDDPSE